MVKDMVYEFLDNYVGEGINISDGARMYDPNDFMPVNIYFVYSNNQTRIIQIRYKGDKQSIVYDKRLGEMVSDFFSLQSDESMRYVREWFSDKYNLKKVNDIKKFIPNPYIYK